MSLALNATGYAVHGNYLTTNPVGLQIAAGGLEISADTHRVKANGIHIMLRPIEFRLLFFFMTHAERVYSRSQLLDQVWMRKVIVGERTVDVHIRRLRAALKPFGTDSLIQTVHGNGYRFSVIRGKPDAEAKPGLRNLAGAFGDQMVIPHA